MILIFSLSNKHIIICNEHFTHLDDGAVLFNSEGKRIFLQAFKEKLKQTLTVRGEKMTYDGLIRREVYNLKEHILNGDRYTPYRYE